MPETNVITDANYCQQLGHATGVAIFFKKLCPNCKALDKMLDKFFEANPAIGHWRIDSEDCPMAMKHCTVERVPTLIVLKDGQVAASKVGLMNLREMSEFYLAAQQ